MRFFPDITEEFTSPLPPAELLRRLQTEVQPAHTFSGSVADIDFSIRRVIDYRNAMLPCIKGQVAAKPAGGSCLRLQHSLHPGVMAFAVFWLGSVVLAMAGELVQAVLRGKLEALSWPDLIPVGLFAAGLLLFTLPFWAEVRQSRPRLIKMLDLMPLVPADVKDQASA